MSVPPAAGRPLGAAEVPIAAPVDPVVSPAGGAGVVNLANALTLLRLLLVPVFVALLLADDAHADGWRIGAFFTYLVASVTDQVDGAVARSRGLVTDVGKVADPIADKALTCSAVVVLSALGHLAWWVTAVLLVRDIGVTLLRFWVIRHGVIPASRGGKLKTLLQNIAIALYVLPLAGWPTDLRHALMLLAVAVSVITGADYVARAVSLRRTALAAR